MLFVQKHSGLYRICIILFIVLLLPDCVGLDSCMNHYVSDCCLWTAVFHPHPVSICAQHQTRSWVHRQEKNKRVHGRAAKRNLLTSKTYTVKCKCDYYGSVHMVLEMTCALLHHSLQCSKQRLKTSTTQELCVGIFSRWLSMAGQLHTSLRWVQAVPSVGWSGVKQTTAGLVSSGNVVWSDESHFTPVWWMNLGLAYSSRTLPSKIVPIIRMRDNGVFVGVWAWSLSDSEG